MRQAEKLGRALHGRFEGPASFSAASTWLSSASRKARSASVSRRPAARSPARDRIVAQVVERLLDRRRSSVQSASIGTTLLLFDQFAHRVGLDGQLAGSVLQVGHQLAVKSTITVLPSAREPWPAASGEKGCQGIFDSCSSTVKAKQPDQRGHGRAADPGRHACARRAVSGVRPIHQQANHSPTSSVKVGTK